MTICVPDSQRSWIGKAHFAGKDVHARFGYMDLHAKDDVLRGPYMQPQRIMQGSVLPCIANAQIPADAIEWCMVDGTPATCTDIGLHHLSTSDVDLVLSGPNVGRNTSAAYITSSGTVGAAMEAVISGGKRAIALSWAYFDGVKHVSEEMMVAASAKSCEVIDALWRQWDADTELYSVNVPLVKSLGPDTKAVFAPILQTTWCSVYENGHDVDAHADADAGGQGITFKWSPDFKKQRDAIFASEGMNDGRAIESEMVSVTPLQAVFHQVAPLMGRELALVREPLRGTPTAAASGVIVLTIAQDEYIYQPLVAAFQRHLSGVAVVESAVAGAESAARRAADAVDETHADHLKMLQYGDYEQIDMERLMRDASYYANTYIYRKALIRKHYLSHTIHAYVAKHPDSVLKRASLETFPIDVDYAEFLDDALDECWELRQELESEQRWWILKPSMSDKAQGIRVFKTIQDLQAVFDSFEEEADGDRDDAPPDENRVVASQLRHFIVQEYVEKPLLLPSMQNRKFHIRCYVTCRGDLQVFVYQRMLALFAPSPFVAPGAEYTATDIDQLSCHLTNTCIQTTEDAKQNAVREFDNLADLSEDDKNKIKEQIRDITRELFLAAVTTNRMNFQPLPNAFETFGLDFLVNSELNVKILEVNAFPDFKQTGDELKGLIDELFEDIVKKCVVPIFAEKTALPAGEHFVKVLDHKSHDW